MDSLFLLQFACFIFMLINAIFVALSHLYVRWVNKRYERSRWMVVFAMIGLAIQYVIQMAFGFRAADDILGAVVNILIYTPCFSLIAMAIYNIETTRANRRKMNLVCGGINAATLLVFLVGISLHHSLYIKEGLYMMLALFCMSVAYSISMIVREMIRCKKMLETMAATDMLPYVRYSRASVFILFLSSLTMPVVIFSTTLLFIIGPFVLLALLFFNLTFIALGGSYTPTEELLDKEEENNDLVGTGYNNGKAHSDRAQSPADYSTESLQPLSDEHRDFIQKSLDAWCANSGYKDCTVNMLTLSRTLSIPKGELSAYFDQYLKTTFRIWLGDIRFNAAKKMMQEYPDYSNDIISAECGFSARTYLYRIFKLKEGCTPTEWREKMAENHSY